MRQSFSRAVPATGALAVALILLTAILVLGADPATAQSEGGQTVPGRIEAESFDRFFDIDSSYGEASGFENVDIDVYDMQTPGESGFVVGRTRAGEWTEYDVTVTASGIYDFSLRAASAYSGNDGTEEPGKVKISLIRSGQSTTMGPVPIARTGGWWTWSLDFVGRRFMLEGNYTVRVEWEAPGQVNFDRLEIKPLAGSEAEPTPTPRPSRDCTGLTQEAEAGLLSGNFRRVDDPAASGGAYVDTPDGSGAAAPDDYIEVCMVVAETGVYRVDARVRATSSTDDSFLVAVGSATNITEKPRVVWPINRTGSFVNDTVGSALVGDPVLYGMRGGGQYRIRVYQREDGAAIDRISLVRNPGQPTDLSGVENPGETPTPTPEPTIAPVGTQVLRAGDGTPGAEFGQSVATSDTFTFVGAPNQAGRGIVYVYDASSTSTSPVATLAGSDAAPGELFGTSVAAAGSRVIVGAPQKDADNRGAAYVFERNTSGQWIETKLTASDASFDDRFGSSVGIAGNRVIVGAPRKSDNGRYSGAAYIFERSSAGQWVETKVLAADAAEFDRFGSSVSISGTRAVVGAPFDDDDGADSGAVYLYERLSAGNWAGEKFTASNATRAGGFGHAVAIYGSRFVVGATADPDSASEGQAYIFERLSDGSWDEAIIGGQDLNYDDAIGARQADFGWSVAVNRTHVVVGAPGFGQSAGSGAIYDLTRVTRGVWNQTKRNAPGAAVDGRYGHSVAVSPSVIAVGAPTSDTNRGQDAGVVQVIR